jgi:hypothetical protein
LKKVCVKNFALGLFVAVAVGLAAGPASANLPGNVVLEQTYHPITVNGHPDWLARFAVVPARRDLRHIPASCAIPLGLPTWAGTFTDANKAYCYQMVGTDPTMQTGKGTTTTLPTQVYAYKLTFSNGMVFDPTAVNTNCDSISPYARMIASPLYQASPITSNGVNLGNIQYEDAQSVGEWHKFVKKHPNYAVNLQDSGTPVVINLTVPSNEGKTQTISGFCNGSIGTVDINWLANQISTTAWSTNQISIVLLWNVFQTSGGSCCILGYHFSWSNSQSQNGVGSITAMNNPGIFSATGITDVHATSHELGELINDPFGNNATPEWGHVGQVSGCQNNLEVGDPLTGTVFGQGAGIQLGGFTYHPQELVYFSWFTETNKPYHKYGAGDLFSMSGSFTAPAKFC